MPVIGLYIVDEKLSQETERIMKLLLVRGAQKDGNDDEERIVDFEIQNPADLNTVSFLILSGGTAQESFAYAEGIWEEYPWLSIIFIAQKPEEVFVALPYPFFHVVRGYALEQDLAAAMKKMERVRPPTQRWYSFLCKSGLVRVRQKDILYLESDRHEIRIHCAAEILITAETLEKCEKKLKNAGFARIHKSVLVNFYHVMRLERESMVLDNGERLYISRYRYPEVKRQFEDYIRRLDFLNG